MTYVLQRKWLLAAAFASMLRTANLQIGMQMYMPPMPPPIYAFPPMAVAIHIVDTAPNTTTTTTTTTTVKPNIAIAVPVPVPMPVQIAVPAFPPPIYCQNRPRSKSCPPCPPCMCLPSCTPAFFSYCSPCHQRCRCGYGEAPVPLPPSPPIPVPGPAYPVPVPVPSPVIGPPPVVVLPYPKPQPQVSVLTKKRRRRRKRRFPIRPYQCTSSDTSDSDCSDSSCTSSESDFFGKKFKRRHSNIFRRTAGTGSESDNELVKPVLSYVAKNGDVKFKTKISKKQALEMINGGGSTGCDEKQTVNVAVGKTPVTLLRDRSGRRYSKVLLKDDTSSHDLKKDKKHMVFRPPPNKLIKEVAMSFQLT